MNTRVTIQLSYDMDPMDVVKLARHFASLADVTAERAEASNSTRRDATFRAWRDLPERDRKDILNGINRKSRRRKRKTGKE